MTDEKIDLKWPKFTAQFMMGLIALACGIFAETRILDSGSGHSPRIDSLLGGALILIPFLVCAVLFRVPYRTDEFERRLRNWSMTQSGIIVLITAVTANLAAHSANPTRAQDHPCETTPSAPHAARPRSTRGVSRSFEVFVVGRASA